MKVKCIRNEGYEDRLTIDVIYEALQEFQYSATYTEYLIMDDLGFKHHFDSERFTEVSVENV